VGRIKKKNQTFLVLNFLLDIFNSVSTLDIKSDCLSREGLNEDLHVVAPNKTRPKRREKEKEKIKENTETQEKRKKEGKPK